MRVLAIVGLLLLISHAAPPVHAVQPDEIFADAVLEQRARELFRGVRCLVCQNQSIDDSDAALAQDLRLLIRERLVAGESDEQIHRFLVARYGEFVLLDPPFRPGTWLLWASPVLALLAGVAIAWAALRRRRSPAEPVALSDDERARLAALAAGDEERQ
ncbi:MAG: cytochrome c-type biogenesis protein CcmH [Alphaproteobacteria bacterium]|nr:cytochrome c-type biogenesis protein CcmH [Alphaproteobacteria bacterium]